MTRKARPREATLDAGVVKSSALVSIAKGEPAAPAFRRGMGNPGKLDIFVPRHAEVASATMSVPARGAVDAMAGRIGASIIETMDFDSGDIPAYPTAAMKYHWNAKPAGPWSE